MPKGTTGASAAFDKFLLWGAMLSCSVYVDELASAWCSELLSTLHKEGGGREEGSVGSTKHTHTSKLFTVDILKMRFTFLWSASSSSAELAEPLES